MSPPTQDWLYDELRAINVKLDGIVHEMSAQSSRIAVVESKVADARGGLKWFGGVVIALLSSALTWLLGTKAP